VHVFNAHSLCYPPPHLQDGAYMNKLFKIFDSMESKRDIEGLNM
jgi:hypothetical protein